VEMQCINTIDKFMSWISESSKLVEFKFINSEVSSVILVVLPNLSAENQLIFRSGV